MKLNQELVREIAHKNNVSEGIFNLFSKRVRNRNSLNMKLIKRELFRAGINCQRKDVIAIFRDLEKARIGKMVTDELGQAKFKLFASISELNRVVSEPVVESKVKGFAVKEEQPQLPLSEKITVQQAQELIQRILERVA